MEVTNRFFAKMMMFSRVFVGEMALSTRDEVEELVSVVRRIEKKGVEVESQSGEGWDFIDESSLSL